MSQLNDRTALIVEKKIPVNCVAIPDGPDGDALLAENPTWVEVTGLDPMPGVGAGWKYEKGLWVAPPPPVLTREEVEAIRQSEYSFVSDPVFFEWQRGEATEAEWLAAVEAVKDANPYPEA